MVIEKLKDRKGSTIIIWLIVIALIFTALTAFITDFANLYSNGKKVKSSVNLSVKSACLQINEDVRLANGEFTIDKVKAYEAFIKILAHNLNLDETTLNPLENSILKEKPIVREFEVINIVSSKYESMTLKYEFEVKNPSVFAVIEFKTKTLFLDGNITVDKLSSGQLTTIYK